MNDFSSFKGRLNRKPFFLRQLILGLFALPISMIIRVPPVFGLQIFLMGLVVGTVISVLIFAQVVKRLHDVDKSGWYSLILFVPLINIAAILALLLLEGSRGTNQYGDDPLLK